MVNMKLSRAEVKESAPASVATDAPRYPYCLTLHLDEDVIDKLDLELPKVGARISMEAVAVVESVSSNKSLDGGNRRSVGLQITDLGLEALKTKQPLEDRLYGKKEGD